MSQEFSKAPKELKSEVKKVLGGKNAGLKLNHLKLYKINII